MMSIINKKVSFDFDHTLSMESVQGYCSELKERDYDIYVTTSRYDDNHVNLMYKEHGMYIKNYNQVKKLIL